MVSFRPPWSSRIGGCYRNSMKKDIRQLKIGRRYATAWIDLHGRCADGCAPMSHRGCNTGLQRVEPLLKRLASIDDDFQLAIRQLADHTWRFRGQGNLHPLPIQPQAIREFED